MKNLIIFICIITSILNLNAQKSIRVSSEDFTLNNKPFSRGEGEELRLDFESVLLKLEYPPQLVEREKLTDVLNAATDEENLQYDYDSKSIEAFKLLQVDYLVKGNIQQKRNSTESFLRIEFIKVSGEDVSSKITFTSGPFKNDDELYNSIIFKTKVKQMLENQVFDKKFGITNKSIYEDIQSDLMIKDAKINTLEMKMDAIIEYSQISKYSLNGCIYDGMMVDCASELVILMDSILIQDTNSININTNLTSLIVLNEVIQKYPKFPFSYFCKAVVLYSNGIPTYKVEVEKAISILEYTTIINQHIPIHDEVLLKCKELLKLASKK